MTAETKELPGSTSDDQPAVKSVTHGPPGFYTPELAGRILREVESGRTLYDVCRDHGIPAYSTVRGWMQKDRDGFAARLRDARTVNRGRRSRATIYTAELAERVLQGLLNGRPLHDICLDDDMPAASTVRLWVSVDRDGFAGRYRHARESGRPPRGGHPTVYTNELAERLLLQLAEGRTLTDVCRDDGMPCHATVRNWVLEDREGFARRYRAARHFGLHLVCDQIMEIADDSGRDWRMRHRKDGTIEAVPDREHIMRSRLRCDVRRRIVTVLSAGLDPGPPSAEIFGQPEQSDELARVFKVIEAWSRELPKRDETGE
jgi:transposase-like protein